MKLTQAATLISQRWEVLPVRREDYWDLFWVSGLPEAWMMSRPGRGDFNTADMTAKAAPHRGTDLPEEARKMEQNREELFPDQNAR